MCCRASGHGVVCDCAPSFDNHSDRGGGLMAKRVLITGVTGQDGAYLAELLLSKGYKVWGIKHRSSNSARPLSTRGE